MYPKMRYLIQVVLTTAVMLAGSAHAQTAAVTAAVANPQVAAKPTNSTAQQSVPGTQSGVHADVSTAPAQNAASPDQSTISVVPQVGIWSLLAALAGLMLMRIWLGGKRKLSTIR